MKGFMNSGHYRKFWGARARARAIRESPQTFVEAAIN